MAGTLPYLDIHAVAWHTDQAMPPTVNSRGWITLESLMARNPRPSGTVFSRAPWFHPIEVADDALIVFYAMDGVLVGEILCDVVRF